MDRPLAVTLNALGLYAVALVLSFMLPPPREEAPAAPPEPKPEEQSW